MDADGHPAALIDSLHRVLWLLENQPRQLSKFLIEAGPNREQMRLVVQALLARAQGRRTLGCLPDGELAVLAKLAANWRSVVDDAIISAREREDRRVGQRDIFGRGKPMSTPLPKSWLEVVALHPDVLAENFSEDIFALDLGPLADKLPSVPAVYRDPEHFFKTSYLTAGLKSLLNDVLLRLSGGEGSRVLKLITPFGGGKSHTLAALWHAAKNRAALDVIPEAAGLPKPPKPVNVAVFDGAFFDALKGKSAPNSKVHANTMWGWIALSLHGEKGYERFKSHDQARVAPGGDEILALLEAGPNLILLDEVLQYLISAGGIKIEQTTLRDETLTFLQRLTNTVTNTKNTALVFTLQSSKRESLDYVNLLQTVDHLAARKDQRREPVEGAEIPRVIQRRLLAKVPSATDAAPAAQAYQEIVTQMRRAHAQTAAEKQQAEEEGIALRDRIRSAYPFHPALVDLMRERWAAIPDFQRTRGALRFLPPVCALRTRQAGAARSWAG